MTAPSPILQDLMALGIILPAPDGSGRYLRPDGTPAPIPSILAQSAVPVMIAQSSLVQSAGGVAGQMAPGLQTNAATDYLILDGFTVEVLPRA